MTGSGAIIVIQREIDRVYAAFVTAGVVDGVGFADGIRGGRAQLLFQRLQKSTEDVDHEAIGAADDVPDGAVHDGIEYQGAFSVRRCRLIDPLDHVMSFFLVVYI